MVENHIKEYRLKLDMSQGQLSRKSGVSASTISEVETGKHTPTIEVALRLAQGLQAPVEELFSLLE